MTGVKPECRTADTGREFQWKSFEMWCWRRMDKIMWEMKKYYLKPNEQRNILHEIRKRKANWIGHILRRNCLLKQVIERKTKGEMEVRRRRGRRRRKLLDDLKDRMGYTHLKEEALDRTMWRNGFGGGFEHVVRQNIEWMNYELNGKIDVLKLQRDTNGWFLLCGWQKCCALRLHSECSKVAVLSI